MNKIAAAALTLLLASPALAQTGTTTPTASGNRQPPVTGSVDAPKTTSSETTPQQQLPGEAKATTSTDPATAMPTRVQPRRHRAHVKAAPNGASDEPGAPPH
jgi:hypothetical protein